MSQQDNFGSGFLVGTLFGGIVGGIVGAVVASRLGQMEAQEGEALPPATKTPESLGPDEAEMEVARRGLEDKIAQLNTAIDDVRQRLGGVNGHAQASQGEEPSTYDLDASDV
jgi:gas vesicle protein